VPRSSGAARRDEAEVCDPRSPGDHRGALGAPEGLVRPGGGAGGYGDADSDARGGVAAPLGARARGGQTTLARLFVWICGFALD
jgi:hypothetical protein